MRDRRAEMLRHFATFLARWRGAIAQLREMTESHRTLHVLLQAPGRNGHLLIACIDPQHISAPISWQSASIQIEVDEGDGFLIFDPSAGVRIKTGSVEVKEFD